MEVLGRCTRPNFLSSQRICDLNVFASGSRLVLEEAPASVSMPRSPVFFTGFFRDAMTRLLFQITVLTSKFRVSFIQLI